MRHVGFMKFLDRVPVIAAVLAVMASVAPACAADPGFTQFIASLWPEAQAAGVSRATFDAETRGLEPDYKLPDLILPGRRPNSCRCRPIM
jgi:membrane-bound lytic murein transglycosylase B